MKLSPILMIVLLILISISLLAGSAVQDCGGDAPAPEGPLGTCYIHFNDDTVIIENTFEEVCSNKKWDTEELDEKLLFQDIPKLTNNTLDLYQNHKFHLP